MEHALAIRSETKRLVNQSESKHVVHRSDEDEQDENVKQLDECSSLYLKMQDCVVSTNRNWKECQPEVAALKRCFEGRKQNRSA